jgi:DNA invertase Pin-like site-specific DNA recombinase
LGFFSVTKLSKKIKVIFQIVGTNYFTKKLKMKIGYARVSTLDQNPELQLDALKQACCERIFEDKASGAKTERPGLTEALRFVRSGDSLVVWRLDRLGRSLKHLIEVVEQLETQGVGFVSLQEGFDTATSGGRLVFQLFGALAEFERNLIRERTQAGLTAARARGRVGGRRVKLTTAQIATLQNMHNSRAHTVQEICQVFGITKPTFYRYLGL